MYPQIYHNKLLLDGLRRYCARLKGELKRADRDMRARRADRNAIQARRDHYAGVLTHVELTLLSLAPKTDFAAIRPLVTLLEPYLTDKNELRREIIRQLKIATEPLTLNALHARIVASMKLEFETEEDRARHRAVIMDALHRMRRATPSVVEALLPLKFGQFNQPEQLWRLRNLRG